MYILELKWILNHFKFEHLLILFYNFVLNYFWTIILFFLHYEAQSVRLLSNFSYSLVACFQVPKQNVVFYAFIEEKWLLLYDRYVLPKLSRCISLDVSVIYLYCPSFDIVESEYELPYCAFPWAWMAYDGNWRVWFDSQVELAENTPSASRIFKSNILELNSTVRDRYCAILSRIN